MPDISYTSPYPSGWVNNTTTPFNATVGRTLDAGIAAATTQANAALAAARSAVVAAGGTPPPLSAISYTSPYPSGWVNNTTTPWSARVGRIFDAGISAAVAQANAALSLALGGTGGTGGGAFTVAVTQPTAANAGIQIPSSSLTVHEGDIIVTTAGTTIENLLVRGIIDIRAANVTVQNCRVVGRRFSSYPGWDAMIHASSAATNALIQFNECTMYDDTLSQDNWVDPGSGYHAYFMAGIKVVGGSGTIARNNVHDCNHLTELGGGTWVHQANYCHSPSLRTDDADHASDSAHPSWSHNDGVHISGGTNHIVQGNTFEMRFSTLTGMNSTANPNPTAEPVWPNCHGTLIQSRANAITGLLIDSNWYKYGAIGPMFTTGTASGGTATLSNNRITPNQSREYSAYTQIDVETGYWAVTVNGNTYSADPDTPSAVRGQALHASTTSGTTRTWRYATSFTGTWPAA